MGMDAALAGGRLTSAREHFACHVFQDLLRRAPSTAECADWVERLRAGTSREELAARLLAGAEYRTHALDALYRRLLGRPPDGRELAEQLRRLDRGEALEHVEADLLATEE